MNGTADADAQQPTRLFHYTCTHGAAAIRRDRVVRAYPHPYLPRPLSWFTDLDVPAPAALGLTAHNVCDRTAHRFSVRTTAAVWWPDYAQWAIAPDLRRDFDQRPGALPDRWWVATEPVPIEEEASA